MNLITRVLLLLDFIILIVQVKSNDNSNEPSNEYRKFIKGCKPEDLMEQLGKNKTENQCSDLPFYSSTIRENVKLVLKPKEEDWNELISDDATTEVMYNNTEELVKQLNESNAALNGTQFISEIINEIYLDKECDILKLKYLKEKQYPKVKDRMKDTLMKLIKENINASNTSKINGTTFYKQNTKLIYNFIGNVNKGIRQLHPAQVTDTDLLRKRVTSKEEYSELTKGLAKMDILPQWIRKRFFEKETNTTEQLNKTNRIKMANYVRRQAEMVIVYNPWSEPIMNIISKTFCQMETINIGQGELDKYLSKFEEKYLSTRLAYELLSKVIPSKIAEYFTRNELTKQMERFGDKKKLNQTIQNTINQIDYFNKTLIDQTFNDLLELTSLPDLDQYYTSKSNYTIESLINEFVSFYSANDRIIMNPLFQKIINYTINAAQSDDDIKNIVKLIQQTPQTYKWMSRTSFSFGASMDITDNKGTILKRITERILCYLFQLQSPEIQSETTEQTQTTSNIYEEPESASLQSDSTRKGTLSTSQHLTQGTTIKDTSSTSMTINHDSISGSTNNDAISKTRSSISNIFPTFSYSGRIIGVTDNTSTKLEVNTEQPSSSGGTTKTSKKPTDSSTPNHLSTDSTKLINSKGSSSNQVKTTINSVSTHLTDDVTITGDQSETTGKTSTTLKVTTKKDINVGTSFNTETNIQQSISSRITNTPMTNLKTSTNENDGSTSDSTKSTNYDWTINTDSEKQTSTKEKLNKSISDLIKQLKEYKKQSGKSFTKIGESFGTSETKETKQIISALNEAIKESKKSKSKRTKRENKVEKVLIGFGNELMMQLTNESNNILSELFKGIVKGAQKLSNDEMKEKIKELDDSLGLNPEKLGENAAKYDMNENNGKETNKIIKSLISGLKSLNSKLKKDETKGQSNGSNGMMVALVCLSMLILCLIIALIVWKMMKRNKNKNKPPSKVMSDDVMTEMTQQSEFDVTTEKSQIETLTEKSQIETLEKSIIEVENQKSKIEAENEKDPNENDKENQGEKEKNVSEPKT